VAGGPIGTSARGISTNEVDWQGTRRDVGGIATVNTAPCRHSGCEPGDLRLCCRDGLGSLVGTECDALGADERHVGDAEEAEDAAQVILLVIEEGDRRLRAVEAAARGRDDDPLAAPASPSAPFSE